MLVTHLVYWLGSTMSLPVLDLVRTPRVQHIAYIMAQRLLTAYIKPTTQ